MLFEIIKQRNKNIFLKQLGLVSAILERKCPLTLTLHDVGFYQD